MMTNIIGKALLSANESDFNACLVNIMHRLNYIEACDLMSYYDYTGEITTLTENKKSYLCRLAMIIEYYTSKRHVECPEWVRDKTLYLNEPYFNDKTLTTLFFAPQACYNHNVFYDENSLTVM